MKKKILAALTAGILTTGLMTGSVFAADTEVKGDENLKGEVYAFIAASLSNSMEEIQKDFNELYPNVTIYYSADSSGTQMPRIWRLQVKMFRLDSTPARFSTTLESWMM